MKVQSDRPQAGSVAEGGGNASLGVEGGEGGAGGLGNFAIKYGYQRFNTDLMLATVVILVVLVQLLQSVGDRIVRTVSHRR